MRRTLIATAAALLALAGSVQARSAQAQVLSRAPATVAVTIYRAPERDADTAIDRDWLQGYALVTEQRRVTLPAGRTTVRFEGVAAGILPESAIVSGLPQGVREKNLDADLLSPRSLYALGFGRPVTIRRQIGKKITLEPAIIRSGPDGAAILQTRHGFEAADCGPQNDSLRYPALPPGLSATPTLSVEIDSPRRATVTLTLSYLAWGFDWQANYVATLRPDGQSADLIAWVTLASSDTTSFPAAETMVVAGKVKREDRAPSSGARGDHSWLDLHCFAHPIVIAESLQGMMAVAVAAPSAEAMDIVVTASRRKAVVTQEDLGDLKLYRVPFRTTVAAMAQKQVALLDKAAVPVEIVYISKVDEGELERPIITLRALNRTDRGLGVPLPAGPVAVFQRRGARAGAPPLLIGEGALDDKAIGEEVEIRLSEATQVTVEDESKGTGQDWEDHGFTVRNANPFPIRFEARFDGEDAARILRRSAALVAKDGKSVWAVTVPANGSRRYDYRLKDE